MCAGGADDPDVGVLGERRRLDLTAHVGSRHVGVGLELRGQRQPDQLGGAHDVGAEQLAVGQHAVDQGGGIDDQIDGVGQPLPGLLVQAQVGFALVAGDDLQMIGGQFLEVPQQFRVAAVEGLVQTAPRILVGLGPHQADQLAVDQFHPLQPFQGQVTPEETGRAGQQDRPHLGARAWQRRGGGQRRGVDELVQREVAGVHLGGVAAVHGRKARP